MFDTPAAPHWPSLLKPLADASKALGHLACRLQSTPLHQGWLWRETARASAIICQVSGHRVRAERLMSSLSGIPLDLAEDDTGLAAARRIFLASAPLFRTANQADSKDTDRELFEPLWSGEAPQVGDKTAEGQGRGDRDHLLFLADDLAGQAGLGTRPVLLDLLLGLRRHADASQLPRAGRLPPSLVRLALPLALHRTASSR